MTQPEIEIHKMRELNCCLQTVQKLLETLKDSEPGWLVTDPSAFTVDKTKRLQLIAETLACRIIKHAPTHETHPNIAQPD